MSPRFLKTFTEKFGIKVFAIFAVFIFVISCSFTAFFIHHQIQSLRNTLIGNGKLLVSILAYNSRIGVFSENEKLLKDPIDAIFEQEEVLEVSVFNQEGALLNKQERPGTRPLEESVKGNARSMNKIFEELKESLSSLYLESNAKLEFWSPVISSAGYSREESLFFSESPLKRNSRIIGFVGITVDKGVLNERFGELLFEGILIGVVFLVMCSGVTYFVAKGITKPLNKLTEGVKRLEKGDAFEKVPVETEDEIGKLAKAFNNMSESLRKREGALRDSEKKLRSLSSQLLKAQEKERVRLSKELHDELGQDLAVLKHRIRSIQGKIHEDQSSLRDECDDMSQYIDQIIDNVRRLSRDLSPSILEDLGLSAALRWLIDNFAEQHSIQTSIDIENTDNSFSREAQRNLYRILQEALTNIGKHAEATHIAVTVKNKDDCIFFLIEDDGKGFDGDRIKNRHPPGKGMGLATMEERAHMLGATLNIRSHPRQGTRITLAIPIEDGGMG